MPYHNRDPKGTLIWEFPKIRGTVFGGLIIRILLFRVLHQGPLFSETPILTTTQMLTLGGLLGCEKPEQQFNPPPPKTAKLTAHAKPKAEPPPPKKKKKREAVRLSICSLTSTLWAKVQDVPLAQQFLACSSSRTRPCFSLRIGVHENHRLRSKPQTLT